MASSRDRSAAAFSMTPETSKWRAIRRKRKGEASSCSEVSSTTRFLSSWRFLARTTTTS
jgi:hypothetical protein